MKPMNRNLVVGTFVLAALAARTAVRGAEPEQIKAAAEKSLALLQECGPKFFAASNLVARHGTEKSCARKILPPRLMKTCARSISFEHS